MPTLVVMHVIKYSKPGCVCKCPKCDEVYAHGNFGVEVVIERDHYILFSKENSQCRCGTRPIPKFFETEEKAEELINALNARISREGTFDFMDLEPIAQARPKSNGSSSNRKELSH